MKNVILRTIKKYNLFKENDRVVLAISGGADSMALLHVLLEIKNQYNLQLIVAHVNHKKRLNSQLDEVLVEKIASENNLPYEVYYLPKDASGANFHDYARTERYEFFKRVAQKYQATGLVTAHHADDHLETQIHRLLYQSTAVGLIGIEPKIDRNELQIIRPLIEVTKEMIYDYCHTHQVLFREDESNESDDYTRNRIRHYIIPTLKKESHSVYQHSRLISEQLSEDEQFFNNQIDELMKNVIVLDRHYEISRGFLAQLPPSLSKRLIKRILQQFTLKDIQTHHITEVMGLVMNEKPNLQLKLPHQICCMIAYDSVVFTTINNRVNSYDFVLNLNSIITLPNAAKLELTVNKVDEKTEKSCINKVHLCYNEIELPLMVRTRKPGDRIQLMNGYGSKKIKEIMIEEKVPKSQRDTWPIIVDANDRIIWVPMLKKSAYCLKTLKGNLITIDYNDFGGK